MVKNNCRHDGDFALLYVGLEETYAWVCSTCMTYKLTFNPVQAGKVRGVTVDGHAHMDSWVCQVMAYVKKEPTTQKLGPMSKYIA